MDVQKGDVTVRGVPEGGRWAQGSQTVPGGGKPTPLPRVGFGQKIWKIVEVHSGLRHNAALKP